MKNKEKLIEFISKFIYIILAIYMFVFADRHSFWIDELDWTLGVVDNKSFIEILKELLTYGYNLPLYYIIISVFYRINPLNKLLLIFPSIVFTLFGIFIIYIISRKLLDKRSALLSLIIIASSGFIFSQIAWQVRPYALLFFLSALTLYLYIEKYTNDNMKNNVLYYFSITLLLFTHWFGALLVLCYGITDCILLLRKKISLKKFALYIIPFILIVGWLILVIKYHINNLNEYWAVRPNIKSILVLIFYLTNIYSIVLLILCVIAKCKKIKLVKKKNDFFIVLNIIYTISIVSVVLIYSNFINRESSIWVLRYFIVIFPHSIIFTSYLIIRFLDNIFINKSNNDFYKEIKIVVIICTSIVTILANFIDAYTNPDTTTEVSYEEVFEYIYENNIGYDDDTLIMCTYGVWWIDYYFLQRNIEVPHNIISVNPKEFGNNTNYELKIDEFRYYIKDSKILIEKEKTDLKDIFTYDKICLVLQYRSIDEKLLEEINLNYDAQLLDNERIILLKKK